ETRFLLTNILGNSVSVVTRDGQRDEVITNLASPTGIANDGRYFYVANYGSTRRSIEWYSLDSLPREENGVLSTPAAESPINHLLVDGLANVTNLVLGADDRLYFAYTQGDEGVVGRINLNCGRETGHSNKR